MQTSVTLKGTVARNQSVRAEDTLATKKALSELGFYKIPGFGLTPWPDEAMFQGLKRFQKAEGLPVDGVLKPDGETAQRLYGAAGRRQRRVERKSEARETVHRRKSVDDAGSSEGPSRSKSPVEVLPAGTREKQVRARKGISIDAVTNTLGVDGIRYTVDWYQLNEAGEVIPEFRREDHRPAEGGGHVLYRVPSRRDFVPPRASEHGYLFIIRVPPQEAYNGNSAGVDLKIFDLE